MSLNQKILPANETPELKELSLKKIGFDPLYFCEFFEGKKILQIYGEESKEYIHGIYRYDEFCGFVYLGEKLSWKEVAEIADFYFPKHLCYLQDYVNKFWGKIWYWEFDQNQYAFIYQRVVKKI